MARSLLVPLDGSALAEQALPLATTIARACRAKLRLVTVHVPPPPPVEAGLVELYVSADLARRREERAYLRQVAERLRAEGPLTVVTVILDGPVADAIAEHAEAADAWMVVMTTHGRGRLGRLWLGSVADALIRKLTIPVLLVRPRDAVQVPIPVADRRILIPLDMSPTGEAAVDPAVELALPMGLALRLVHVLQPPLQPLLVDPADYPLPGDELVLESLRRRADGYLTSVAATLRGRGLRVDTLIIVAMGVAEAILEEARGDDVALVAMSTHGRGGIRRLLIGSVTDKVVRASDRPVLVVRPAGRPKALTRRAADAAAPSRRKRPSARSKAAT